MSECICLIAGVMIGGIFGVTIMSLLQINRLKEMDSVSGKENDNA